MEKNKWRKTEGNALLIVVILMSGMLLVMGVLIETVKMRYEVVQTMKQTSNTYYLAESSIEQYGQAIHNMIKIKMPEIIIKNKQSLFQEITGVDKEMNDLLLQIGLMEEIERQIKTAYFKTTKVGNDSEADLWAPIQIYYQIKSDTGKRDRISTIYIRVYVGESLGYITRDKKVLKSAVENLFDMRDCEALTSLLKKQIKGDLTQDEATKVEELKYQLKTKDNLIVQARVETKDNKGRIFNSERMIAGVKWINPLLVRHEIKPLDEGETLADQSVLEIEENTDLCKITWMKKIK